MEMSVAYEWRFLVEGLENCARGVCDNEGRGGGLLKCVKRGLLIEEKRIVFLTTVLVNFPLFACLNRSVLSFSIRR